MMLGCGVTLRTGAHAAKRVAAGAVAVLLALVVGCSSTDVGNVRQDPHAVLQVWIRQTPGSAAANTEARLVAAFSKATGYKANAIALYDDFETKLEQQAAQRQLPDIVINDTAQVGFMQSQGWLEEIDRTTFANTADLSDRAWKAAQAANGNYYGVPFSAHTFAFFIRSDWRKKLGLALPKTWQDLVNMAVAFTTQDPDGDGRADTYGLDIPGTTKRGYMAWYFTTPLLDNGGDFLRQAQPGRWVPDINSAKSVQAAQWLQQMFCQYKVVNPDAVTIDTPAAHASFEKGVAGMYLTGPYMLPRFLKSMGGAELDVVPMPAGPGGGPSALAEGENVYLTRGSPNRAAQMAFAEFATSVQGQTIGMDGDNSGPIVRLPVNTKVDMMTIRHNDQWKTFQQIYDQDSEYAPSVPNWTAFRQSAADSLNAVMANCSMDVKSSMDKLASSFAAELKRQGVLGD
jgi:multiple sugar transport system substrate-binding protein